MMSKNAPTPIVLSQQPRLILSTLLSTLQPLGCDSAFFSAIPMPGKDFTSLILHNSLKIETNSNIITPDPHDIVIQKATDWHYPFILKSCFYTSSALARKLELGKEGRELLIVPIVTVPKFHGVGLILFTRAGEYANSLPEESLSYEVKFTIGAAIDATFSRLHELAVLHMKRKGELTAREREVVTFSALGNTSGEIAMQIGLTERTVNAHIQNSCKKLGAQNKAECVLQAIRYRQIGPGAGLGFYQLLNEIFAHPYNYRDTFA